MLTDEGAIDWALVGINVRRARILRGMTQADLARKAKVGISTVYHAEQGRPLIRRSFEAICEALGALPDHIRARTAASDRRSHVSRSPARRRRLDV